jgi:hypothetical protein
VLIWYCVGSFSFSAAARGGLENWIGPGIFSLHSDGKFLPAQNSRKTLYELSFACLHPLVKK